MSSDNPAGAGTDGVSRGRLRWLCRRGMRELDVLLSAFLDRHYDAAPAEEQAAFAALLEQPDPEIRSWLLGEQPVGDPVMQRVVDRIRRRA